MFKSIIDRMIIPGLSSNPHESAATNANPNSTFTIQENIKNEIDFTEISADQERNQDRIASSTSPNFQLEEMTNLNYEQGAAFSSGTSSNLAVISAWSTVIKEENGADDRQMMEITIEEDGAASFDGAVENDGNRASAMSVEFIGTADSGQAGTEDTHRQNHNSGISDWGEGGSGIQSIAMDGREIESSQHIDPGNKNRLESCGR